MLVLFRYITSVAITVTMVPLRNARPMYGDRSERRSRGRTVPPTLQLELTVSWRVAWWKLAPERPDTVT